MARSNALPVEIDPVTKKIRTGTVVVARDSDRPSFYRVTLSLPRNLKSPNANAGRHWSARHANTKAWETLIKLTIGDALGASTISGYSAPVEALGLSRPTGKVRVHVERRVPSYRNFVQDSDNLRFTTKPLNDALKRLGFLKDDSDKFLEQQAPSQVISADRLHWTVITIEPVVSYAAAGGFDVMAETLLRKTGLLK